MDLRDFFLVFLMGQGGVYLFVYCLNQRSTVAIRLFHGLQASLQDVFEVVINVNRVERLQVFLDPWVQDRATIGDAKVSGMNGTRRCARGRLT